MSEYASPEEKKREKGEEGDREGKRGREGSKEREKKKEKRGEELRERNIFKKSTLLFSKRMILPMLVENSFPDPGTFWVHKR